jgi:pyrroline-5-carboxylate reductase
MNSALNCNISFIGGGNMAQALIGGLISRGLPENQIQVSDPVEQIRSILQEKILRYLLIMLKQLKMQMWSCLQ